MPRPRSPRRAFLADCARASTAAAPALARELRGLLHGRQISAELLEELETRLIGADLGVIGHSEILEDLRDRAGRHELLDVEALLAALRARLTEILQALRAAAADRSQRAALT